MRTTYNGNTYTVTCTPVTGTACQVVVHTVVNVSPVTITTTTDTVCPGQAASISATGGGTYAWSDGGSSAIDTPSPTVTTTYTVTVTANGGGCSNSGTTAVVVNTVPVANAGPPVQICPGTPTTLDASGSSGGSGPLSYNWSPPGGNTAQITVSPTTTTSYTVTVTAKGCTSTSSVTVTVANNLVTNVKPDTTICPGQPVPLTATGGSTFAWAATPPGSLSATTGNSVTATPSMTTVYTVTGTSGTCTASSFVTVTVRNGLALTLSPNDTICPNNSVTLTAGGATTYAWNTSGTNDTIIVSPSTTTIYSVTGTANGCSGSQTVEVVISNHLPVAILLILFARVVLLL